MLVGLSGTHEVRSNSESGLGRFDVAIWPRARSGYQLGVILDFKKVENAAGLIGAAEDALAQNRGARIWVETPASRVKKVLGVGLAFAGKEMAATSRMREMGTPAR